MRGTNDHRPAHGHTDKKEKGTRDESELSTSNVKPKPQEDKKNKTSRQKAAAASALQPRSVNFPGCGRPAEAQAGALRDRQMFRAFTPILAVFSA